MIHFTDGTSSTDQVVTDLIRQELYGLITGSLVDFVMVIANDGPEERWGFLTQWFESQKE